MSRGVILVGGIGTRVQKMTYHAKSTRGKIEWYSLFDVC
jgi:dTDP-glucose pyrophosphorylase